MMTEQLALLAFLQAMEIGAAAWRRRTEGQLTDEEFAKQLADMKVNLAESDRRLDDLIAEKRAAGSTTPPPAA